MDGQQQIKRQPATGGTFARFNMRAFIFNSFYYFYHGIRSDRFWLFFSATPVLTYLLLKPGLPVIAAATAAVLAVRIIAAFRADGDIQRQREENAYSRQRPEELCLPERYSARRLCGGAVQTLLCRQAAGVCSHREREQICRAARLAIQNASVLRDVRAVRGTFSFTASQLCHTVRGGRL